MIHHSTVLCLNVGAKGKQEQRNQAIVELVEASGAELVLVQEYYYTGTTKLLASLPHGWREVRHGVDVGKPDTLVLFDTTKFQLAGKQQAYGQAGDTAEARPSLRARYSAVRLEFIDERGTSSTGAKPAFMLISYHGKNNNTADPDAEPATEKEAEAWDKERWKFAREMVTSVGEAACKAPLPALIGGDWNTNSHAPGRRWPGGEGRWEGKVVDVAHFSGGARRYQDSSARIDFFYAIQPAAVVRSTTRQAQLWRLSLGNVTAIAHSEELRGLFDHDPIVASLRLDPPGATPERLTFRRHPLAFAPLAEIDAAALPDGELRERCRQLGSEVEALRARVAAAAAERDTARARAAALQSELDQAAAQREAGQRAVREAVERAHRLEAEILQARMQAQEPSRMAPIGVEQERRRRSAQASSSEAATPDAAATAATPPPRPARQRNSESPELLPTPSNSDAPAGSWTSPGTWLRGAASFVFRRGDPSTSEAAPSPRLPTPEPAGAEERPGGSAGTAGSAGDAADAGRPPVLARRSWLEKMRPADLEKEARALGIASPEDRGAVLDTLCRRRYIQLRFNTLRNLCRDHKLGYADGIDTKETMAPRLEAAQERAAAAREAPVI